jgi:hypothetical protein
MGTPMGTPVPSETPPVDVTSVAETPAAADKSKSDDDETPPNAAPSAASSNAPAKPTPGPEVAHALRSLTTEAHVLPRAPQSPFAATPPPPPGSQPGDQVGSSATPM